MATVEHVPEWTDNEEYAAHHSTYRRFIRLLWWNVAGIAVVLIGLALWAG
jgi:hypothetical protein